jgi:hypothetical protein
MSHLVACLKLIYSSIQVSDVLVVRCKLIDFVFQIFPLFIPEISAGFMSYIVQIIPKAFHIPYVYDYITKSCRQQAEVIQNHENENVRYIGQGEA